MHILPPSTKYFYIKYTKKVLLLLLNHYTNFLLVIWRGENPKECIIKILLYMQVWELIIFL